MRTLGHFLQYHNAVPIALGVLFLGATGVFAATNPEVIYDEEQKVLSVDNTYLAEKDLESFTPRIEILGVTEDEESYYVAYRLSTISLIDYVWKDVVSEDSLVVSRADLGPYRDLGVYVTRQLGQLVDREIALLKETQDIEKKRVSQKMVATVYSGLVGRFLDETTEVLPGYTPIVVPPAPDPVVAFGPGESIPQPRPRQLPQTAVDDVPASVEAEPETPAAPPSVGSSTEVSTSSSTPSEPPHIQILGDNPVLLSVGASYTDLGVVVTDDKDENVPVVLFLNGAEVQSISIDTATSGEHVVAYIATDSDGNTISAERRIIVQLLEMSPETGAASTSDTPNSSGIETPESPVSDTVESQLPAPEETPAAPIIEPTTTEQPVPAETSEEILE